MRDSKIRFSDRVADYVKYRPSYPEALMNHLTGDLQVNSESIVADVGAGTGIFSKLLAAIVAKVYGIEPNREMREASCNFLRGFDNFQAVDGSSEATKLDDGTVDFITAAQSFHWFEPVLTKQEFQRILRPDGLVVLIWNHRLIDTPFLQKYETILRNNAPEYELVNHTKMSENEIRSFYGGEFRKENFPHVQILDWESLLGRVNSSSYVPKKNTKENRILEKLLRAAYESESDQGIVEFRYACEVYSGKLQ